MSEVHGVFVEDVTSAGTTAADAASIPLHHGVTYVRTAGGAPPHPGVILPSGANIGDVVQVYSDGSSVSVYPPSGEAFRSTLSFRAVDQNGAYCVKIATNEWGP